MKICFSDSSFRDYSRVGYDYSFPTYSITSGDTANSDDEIVVPEDFTIEEARALAEAMLSFMMEGYSTFGSYKRALKKLGKAE